MNTYCDLPKRRTSSTSDVLDVLGSEGQRQDEDGTRRFYLVRPSFPLGDGLPRYEPGRRGEK